MFIVEIGNGPAARPEHFHRLLEELITRVLRLPLLVARVIALLADVDDSVHRELARAPCQGVRDAGVDLHAWMPLRPLGDKIAFASLFDIDRHDVERRLAKYASKAVSIEDAVDDVLRVQVKLICIGQYRDLRPF